VASSSGARTVLGPSRAGPGYRGSRSLRAGRSSPVLEGLRRTPGIPAVDARLDALQLTSSTVGAERGVSTPSRPTRVPHGRHGQAPDRIRDEAAGVGPRRAVPQPDCASSLSKRRQPGSSQLLSPFADVSPRCRPLPRGPGPPPQGGVYITPVWERIQGHRQHHGRRPLLFGSDWPHPGPRRPDHLRRTTSRACPTRTSPGSWAATSSSCSGHGTPSPLTPTRTTSGE